MNYLLYIKRTSIALAGVIAIILGLITMPTVKAHYDESHSFDNPVTIIEEPESDPANPDQPEPAPIEVDPNQPETTPVEVDSDQSETNSIENNSEQAEPVQPVTETVNQPQDTDSSSNTSLIILILLVVLFAIGFILVVKQSKKNKK